MWLDLFVLDILVLLYVLEVLDLLCVLDILVLLCVLDIYSSPVCPGSPCSLMCPAAISTKDM